MSDELPTISVPPLGGAADESWTGLLDLADEMPEHWCLVGGFMVLLHCLERGVVPTRPTDDGDAVVDVRARPTMLRDLTSALVRMGELSFAARRPHSIPPLSSNRSSLTATPLSSAPLQPGHG